MSTRTFVVVGASLAGARAVGELRERGFDGRIVLVGAEPELPYERPPLSKAYLQGESERTKMLVHDAEFYDEHEIELLLGTRVTHVDPDSRSVTLADDRRIAYDALLLSTGAEPRRLEVPGAGLEGIHYLRTVADCDALRAAIERGGHAAVVGAGWIGSEVAASIRQRGLDVTLIDPQELPNERVFGPTIGRFYRDVHADRGVELLLGDGVASFAGTGRVEAVRTSSGREVGCDFVVVGVGVTPRVELARAGAIPVDDGITTDAQLRSATPGVYAAGDVANAWHPFYGRRIRLEHWATALKQGPAAARSMLGDETAYDALPYFFSDQYDVGMEYSGLAASSDELVVRGDLAGGAFIAFWLREGHVVAGMNVNVWDVNDDVQALIRARTPVSVAALADPDTPLAALVPATDGEDRR